MKRAWLALLVCLGCQDPAALEVRVLIEESELADVKVSVTRGHADGPAVLDCAMPLDGEPEGLCPFEAGDGRWIDPGVLSFVLYGTPATEVAITIDGRRSSPLFGLAVVTTTQATVALPPNPGERAVLELPLVDRTTPRIRCVSEEIYPETPFVDLGSLVLLEGVDSFAYVALADKIFRARYQRDETSCALSVEEVASVAPCRLRARSLVGRTGGNGSTVLLAGVCSNSFAGQGTTTLQSIIIEESSDRVRTSTLTLPVATGRVTQPVLANLFVASNALSIAEVVVLHARRLNDIALVAWTPATGTSTIVGLRGVRFTTQAGEVLPGPIVRRGPPDQIVVAGYGGTNLVVVPSGRDFLFAPLTTESGLAASRRAPSLALGQPPMLVDVRAEEVRFTPIRFLQGALPRPDPFASVPLAGTVNRDLSARVAIARMGEAGALHAVFADDGIVHIHPLDGRASTTFDAWLGRGVGAQQTLLWNMDGRAGAEIITYDFRDDSLWGASASGLILDEWRPLETERTTNNLAVALAKLGGQRDFDLDVVALAGKYLEVITLGANSAQRGESGWPMPNHDPAGAAVWNQE